jgi:hypothetical protein
LGDEFERSAIGPLRSAERLRFGRVTYEGVAAYWPGAKGEVAELMNKSMGPTDTHNAPQGLSTSLRSLDRDAEIRPIVSVPAVIHFFLELIVDLLNHPSSRSYGALAVCNGETEAAQE